LRNFDSRKEKPCRLMGLFFMLVIMLFW